MASIIQSRFTHLPGIFYVRKRHSSAESLARPLLNTAACRTGGCGGAYAVSVMSLIACFRTAYSIVSTDTGRSRLLRQKIQFVLGLLCRHDDPQPSHQTMANFDSFKDTKYGKIFFLADLHDMSIFAVLYKCPVQ